MHENAMEVFSNELLILKILVLNNIYIVLIFKVYKRLQLAYITHLDDMVLIRVHLFTAGSSGSYTSWRSYI